MRLANGYRVSELVAGVCSFVASNRLRMRFVGLIIRKEVRIDIVELRNVPCNAMFLLRFRKVSVDVCWQGHRCSHLH